MKKKKEMSLYEMHQMYVKEDHLKGVMRIKKGKTLNIKSGK